MGWKKWGRGPQKQNKEITQSHPISSYAKDQTSTSLINVRQNNKDIDHGMHGE
jgi:hypothetical protein